jgi:carboxyl-terminal processing protease
MRSARESQTNTTPSDEVAPKARIRSRFGLIIAGVLIFWFGLLTGQGRLGFSPHYQASNTDLPARLDYTTVNEVYDQLKDKYDGKLTESQLLNGIKSGLANATNDPYTEFFTATEAKSFNNELNNSFSGVGAELGKDTDGNLLVVAPIHGFPAEKAGLKSKDIILAINRESTSGLSVDEAVQKIRGKAGTNVTLTVVRGKSEQLDIRITRQNIHVPSVSHEMLESGIGYIRINTFAEDTSSGITVAAAKLKSQGAKGILLDLRNNPGGLLPAAVAVSSQWLSDGTPVLQEKRSGIVVDSYEASGSSPLQGMPTVVLINGGSASASEIVAGALHDNKAATLIGEKSFGKGVVQQLITLKDGSQLKVTVASWYRPNGENINKKGITPDQTVKPAKTDSPGGTDAQKAAAVESLRKLLD